MRRNTLWYDRKQQTRKGEKRWEEEEEVEMERWSTAREAHSQAELAQLLNGLLADLTVLQ